MSGKIAHFWRYAKTFWDEQETLNALPFIFWHLPRNWHLSKKIHTPALVYRLECDSQNQRQGISSFWSTVPSNHVMSQNKPRDFKIAPKHRGTVGGSSLAQKIKGRASKVYFLPQKVSLMKWRSFGVKVKRPHKTALQPSNFSSFIYPVWADQRWTFWGHFFGIVPNLLSILLARFIHVRDHVVSHLLRASTEDPECS